MKRIIHLIDEDSVPIRAYRIARLGLKPDDKVWTLCNRLVSVGSTSNHLTTCYNCREISNKL